MKLTPTKICLAITLLCTLAQSAWCETMQPPFPTSEELKGRVVDVRSRKPLDYAAVVSVIWVLRFKGKPPDGELSTVTKVEQRYNGEDGNFQIWPLRPFGENWEVVPGQDPLVRIYAKGYQRLEIENVKDGHAKVKRPYNTAGTATLKWIGQNQTQMLKPWPLKQSAQINELRLWRKDLDNSIAATQTSLGGKRAIEGQEKLLLMFNEMCHTLTEQVQKKVCYAPDSEVGRYIAQFADERAKHYLVIEGPDGERQLMTATPAASAPTGEMMGGAAALTVKPEEVDAGRSP